MPTPTGAAGVEQLTLALASVGADAETGGAGMEAFAASITEAGDASVLSAGKLEALGATAATTGGEMDAAGAAAGEAGLAGDMAASEEAAGGLAAGLGPVAIGLGAVVAGAAIFNKVWPAPPLINASAMSFANADNTLKKMSATTLPEMTLKMGELQAAQDQAAKSMHDGGQTGQCATRPTCSSASRSTS